jgi:GTP-binding protein HflX
MWTHLSRQSGGIGTRGPGETQLEVDRRRVQERIARLERDLTDVRKHRSIQREGRRRNHWPVASLVGYTNAGKSTLLNRLTGASVLAANKLFATLDPTTRQFLLPNNQKVLLTDTVGFIRKLPHTVIESFKATLEEVHEADLLIHVVDLSHPHFQEQILAVEAVIRELDADGKQMLTVFNKIDAVEHRELIEAQVRRTPNSVAISAGTGEGMDGMLAELEAQLAAWRMRVSYCIPAREAALIAEIHRVGHVLEIRYEEEEVMVRAHVPPHLQIRLAVYEVSLTPQPVAVP